MRKSVARPVHESARKPICLDAGRGVVRLHGGRGRLAVVDLRLFEALGGRVRLAARRDSARLVYSVLDTLSPKKRMVFILHEILGWSSKEIAEVVQANVMTVRTRLHYARKEFHRKVMSSDLFDGERR